MPKTRMSPVETRVIVEVVPIEAKVRLPVPVKLTAWPVAGARVIAPPTEWGELATWAIPAALVTARLPLVFMLRRVTPPAVSVIETALPLAPTVRKSTAPRVILPAVEPVPASRVTTEPVVLATNALAPWMMFPLVEVPLVLMETRPVVDATFGAIVREPFVGAEIVTVGVDV